MFERIAPTELGTLLAIDLQTFRPYGTESFRLFVQSSNGQPGICCESIALTIP